MAMTHKIEQGECLSSIAKQYGFSHWRTIYNHPQNAGFRKLRPNPNLVYPGDLIFIPDKEQKEVSRQTEMTHVFKKRAPKTVLRLAIKDKAWRPLSGRRYELIVEGKPYRGTTDEGGVLEQEIPADAEQGSLSVWLDGEATGESDSWRFYRWRLKIGHLDPVDEVTGVAGRLSNLGIPCGPVDASHTSEGAEALIEAVKTFQSRVDLGPSGTIDTATRTHLIQAHDKKNSGGKL